ncbi:adenylate kinase [Candidatus Uhrbacteria bacterium]|nr:adenylate kinase [Candidatus Uhrbacteria bacterium]
MLNVIMIGPQGSGKGTQSELLSERLGLPMVSVGQLLRAETDRQTGLGREIDRYLKSGELVPSDIIRHVIKDRLGDQDTDQGVVLDGYPRTVEQAETLDEIMTGLNRHVTHAIYLDISDETAVNRISGRRVCSNHRCGLNYHATLNPPKREGVCDSCGHALTVREDDNPEAIRQRLSLFHEKSQPLADYYERRGILHRFDGNKEIADVSRDILGILRDR